MNSLRALFFFLLLTTEYTAFPQPPEGYYVPAEGLTGKALQQTLHDLIDNHTVIPYSDLFTCFRKTDVRNDSIVWDMYSDRPGGTPVYLYYYGKGEECGNYNSEADCFNREHSFPKSWFNETEPAISDLFHIYPTDGWVNNKRANYPFGETSSPSWSSTNGSKLGPCSWPGYSGIIFEPVDEYKGDFARTCFYMATRYFREDSTWKGSDMVKGAEPKPWALEMLLAWHRNDSVSTKETDRNNAVYAFQKNRNPFIDRPSFAEKIWDSLNGTEDLKIAEPELVIYPNPASGYINLRFTGKGPDHPVVLVYNVSGVISLQTRLDHETTRVDTDMLPPGIYFVKILDTFGLTTGSFIKVTQ